MLWRKANIDSKLVLDMSFRVVCYCDTAELATQIVKDHNWDMDDPALTEDQKEAIRQERREKANNFGSSYRG